MPKQNLPESKRHIRVFVSIGIPQFRAFGAVANQRIDDLFPLPTKARHRPRIGQMPAMLRGVGLRLRGPRRVPRDELCDVNFLPRRKRGRSSVDAAKRTVRTIHRRAYLSSGTRYFRTLHRLRDRRWRLLVEKSCHCRRARQILEKLTECDFDAEPLVKCDGGLCEEKRIEAQLGERKLRRRPGQVDAGKPL